MTPKDILLVVDGFGREAAFAAAEALPRNWQPHLKCLQLVELPDPGPSGAAFTTDVWAKLLAETRKRATEDRTAISQRLLAQGASSEVVSIEGTSGGIGSRVAACAMHADLTIMQRPNGPMATAAFEAALFNSGRPVLVVPPDWRGSTIGRYVMVAWSAKREAARALADAAPFLETAKAITLVAVDVSPAYEGDTVAGCDITAHLSKHGLPVFLRQPDSFGRSTDVALLEEARDCEADLIVMGGYGHSRFREMVLGGVTRALLHSCPRPILFSH